MKQVTVNGRVLNWSDPETLGEETRYTFSEDLEVTQDVRSSGMTLAFRNTTDIPINVRASCEGWEDEWEHLPFAYFIKEFGHQKVSFDLEDLISKGAIPPYERVDISHGFDPDKLARALKPMSTEYNNLNMTNTGQLSRGHVGLMPKVHQEALLTGDDNLIQVAKAYSYGGATIGWHGGFEKNGWKVDEAHQPAFHYIPYLLTKQRIFLDLLHWQADFNIKTDKNLLDGQIRSRAWKARSVIQAAYITPDGHPKKQYYLDQVERLKREFIDTHITAGELTGVEWRSMTKSQDKGFVSPWENDYVMLVLCWAASMKIPLSEKAQKSADHLLFEDIVKMKSPYFINRFTEKPDWPIERGTAYRHKVRGSDGKFFTEFPVDVQEFKERYHNPGHAEDLSRGMLVWLSHFVPEALEVAKKQDALLTAKDKWHEQPKWAIRFPDGVIPDPKPDPKPEPKDEVDPEKAGAVVEDYTVRLGEIDPLTKEALVSETERLLEEVKNIPIMETVLVDQISETALNALLNTTNTDIANLPRTVVTTASGDVTGVPQGEALSAINALKTSADALLVLVEDTSPPIPGEIVVPPFTKLFPLVPMDGAKPLDRGNGFDDGTCTFDPVAELFTAQNTGQVKEWFRMPHSLAPLGSEGTYMVDVFVVRWKEWDWINKRIDENELQPPQWFDFQVGGDGSWHPNIEGDIQDQGLPRHREIYCQFNNMAVCWNDQGVRFYLNGVHTYSHPHTGGFFQNTSRWCFGANDRIKNGNRDQAHTWAGEQFNAVLWNEAIDDKIAPLHAAKYADLVSQGKHVSERLQDGPYDHLRGNAAYSCPTGTNRPLPLSVDDVTV